MRTEARHDAGAGATSPWRRALACLLGLCLLLSSFHANHAAPSAETLGRDPSAAILAADGISYADDAVSDNGQVQKSAHCACFDVAQPLASSSMFVPAIVLIRFVVGDADVPVRPTTPPSRPPRA